MCKFFIKNFKWAIFIFALGNYIFLSPISKGYRLNWSLANLIVFFVLALIPYETIKVNTIGISESESKRDTYKDSYIFFSTDYEKLCPFTRKEAYTNYFTKLINDNIINKFYGTKIILNLQNKNEMFEFIKTKRHLDYYVASQQLNNLYMRNRNATKIKYIFGDEDSDKKNKDITFKSLILSSSIKSDNNLDYNSIRQMKDILYSFYTTTAGISNALIFLDEKRSIINNLDFYNYNPWKADWIYTKNYKNERRNMIHKVRKEMDYKGEVSDDEDSIIKYDESQDQLNEQIRKFNRRSIAFEARPNLKNEDKPVINNQEIITGKVDDDEEDINEDDEISYKILNKLKEANTIKKEHYNTEKGQKIIKDNNKKINLPYYNVVLNYKDVGNNIKGNNNNINNNQIQNNNASLYNMTIQSQNNLMEDGGLFPNKDNQVNNKNNK